MKALILNSGVGKRMGAWTERQPKCLVPIGKEHTILSWQLTLLRELDIKKIIITTGPFDEMLRDYASKRAEGIHFIHNPRYRETNYIYSMYLAKEELYDDILLIHGDVVTEKSVLEDLIAMPESAVAVEKNVPLPEKDFKAKISGGRVVKIGVDVFGADCAASQPVYKLLCADMGVWLREIETFCGENRTNCYAENALNTVFLDIVMRPLALNGRLCNEIDNMEDLRTVSSRFRRLE